MKNINFQNYNNEPSSIDDLNSIMSKIPLLKPDNEVIHSIKNMFEAETKLQQRRKKTIFNYELIAAAMILITIGLISLVYLNNDSRRSESPADMLAEHFWEAKNLTNLTEMTENLENDIIYETYALDSFAEENDLNTLESEIVNFNSTLWKG